VILLALTILGNYFQSDEPAAVREGRYSSRPGDYPETTDLRHGEAHYFWAGKLLYTF
jgi:hypothetical protein